MNEFAKVGRAKVQAMANKSDDFGCTPAHFCAAGGRLDTQPSAECMATLLNYTTGDGAVHVDINAVDNAGFTPLHIAAQNGFPEIVKFLLTRAECNMDLYVIVQIAIRKLQFANCKLFFFLLVSCTGMWMARMHCGSPATRQ